jgi:hypothetical protein
MPFGKHKGEPFSSIPSDYLWWLLRECDLKYPLRVAVEAELNWRGEWNDPEPPEPDPPPYQEATAEPPPDWDAIVAGWYRQLCLDYHPDRGGSHEAMKAINDAYDRLRRMLAEAK